MQVHQITEQSGRQGPERKRVGRGIGSHGKTSGRGHKGESSRSGAKKYLLKEGGQMPLFRKVAKRGFSSGMTGCEKRCAVVSVGAIEMIDPEASMITLSLLVEEGLVPRRTQFLKILGNGIISRSVVIEADNFSRSAIEKIVACGGTAVLRRAMDLS